MYGKEFPLSAVVEEGAKLGYPDPAAAKTFLSCIINGHHLTLAEWEIVPRPAPQWSAVVMAAHAWRRKFECRQPQAAFP